MPVRGLVVNSPARLGWARDRPYQSGAGGPLVVATAAADVSAAVSARTCGAVLIEVSWGTPGVSSVTLTRITPDGAETVVRGSPVQLSAGMAMFWDVEAPFNTPVTYRVSSEQSTNTATSDPVTVVGTGWGCLSDPYGSRTDVPLTTFTATTPDCADDSGVAFVAFGDEDYGSTSGVFDIIDAARPRTVSQTRHDLDSTLQLVSKTLDDRQDLLTLLSTGRDLLLRLTSTAYGWATDTYAAGWVTVGDVAVARGQTARMALSWREWKLPIRRVDAPGELVASPLGSNGIVGGGNTWADLVNAGMTWQQVSAYTWADLIRGTVV